MPTFEDVIKEFQKRRLEREINATDVKLKRQEELQKMADIADAEMRKRRSRKKIASS